MRGTQTPPFPIPGRRWMRSSPTGRSRRRRIPLRHVAHGAAGVLELGHRAGARHGKPDVVFIGEAYDNDPAKVPSTDPVISKLNNGKSNVMFDLLNAGFNGVYDDPTYRVIKKIYEGPGWANDIDGARTDDFIFDNSLRYAENHDEVRLAAKSQWGGIGMKVGVPVSAILYGLSRGPVMVYNGQEVGEPGDGVEGFRRPGRAHVHF